MPKIENARIQEMKALIPPKTLKEQRPLPASARETVIGAREEVRDMIHGKDMHRLLVVIGPCSIHNPEAAFDYAERLKAVADKTKDELVIVMRTYFEKPRTTVGWKGLINDPHLDGSCDIEAGLKLCREIMLGIAARGVPCATEFLDPIVPQYIADLVSWAAIGARTTESQTHRMLASGLSMPVGFKNGTDGSMQSALNAMVSAKAAHSFLGITGDGLTAIVKTTGNPDRHVILRGGGGKTNYHAKDIASAATLVAEQEPIPRGVMVDCAHDNSGKDHTKEAPIFREVVKHFCEGHKAVLGLLVESNLKPGKQAWKEGAKLEPGVSLTDSCIGWEETEKLLLEAAEGIRSCGKKPVKARA